MKKLGILVAFFLVAGCNELPDSQKTVSQLESEIAQKQEKINQKRITGDYPEVRLPAVCIRGVLYYSSTTHHGYRTYAAAISETTLQPERCVPEAP